MTDGRLFDVGPPAPDPPKDSPTVRRTKRQKALLAKGIHPATRLAVRADLGTCKTCISAEQIADDRGRLYWKCHKSRLGLSHSEASDIRVSWPACEGYTR